MNRQMNLILGMAIGAAVMYILDPDRGRRRRARLRDQLVHGAHEAEDFGGAIASKARHLRNRARGTAIEVRSRFTAEEVDDTIIEARVRTQLGRLGADTSAIEVSSEHGRVTLRGHASESDFRHIVEGVHAVPGVHDVINRLEAREVGRG